MFTCSDSSCLSSATEGAERIFEKISRIDRCFHPDPRVLEIMFGEAQFEIGQIPSESVFCCPVLLFNCDMVTEIIFLHLVPCMQLLCLLSVLSRLKDEQKTHPLL